MTRKLTEKRIVVATHNDGKLREIKELLSPLGLAVVSAGALDLPVPEETEDSFAGNARLKAHAAAQATGLPALADDSGLEIEALGGAPGVHTADWAETPTGRDFELAMHRAHDLLEQHKAPEPRRAAFVSTLCLAWPDGHDEIFEGRAEGRFVWPMRGTQGFGFDPVFVPEGETLTFGEMDPARKSELSHRTRAFQALVEACLG